MKNWFKSEWYDTDPFMQGIKRFSLSMFVAVLIAVLVYFPPLAWKGWRDAHYPQPTRVTTLATQSPGTLKLSRPSGARVGLERRV